MLEFVLNTYAMIFGQRLLLRHTFWQRRFYSFKDANKFLKSYEKEITFFFLTVPVVIYPIGSLLTNGPFVSRTFKWRYDVEDNLPEHLQTLINEEYAHFLKNNNRDALNSVVKHHIQNGLVDTDTIVKGTMRLKTAGAHIGLPFFTRFQTYDEAKDYCRKHLGTLKFKNSTAVIDWDSEVGQKLIETFVLSDNAKRFLIYRDFMTCENYQALVNAPVVFGSYTVFSSFFTYVLSKHAAKSWNYLKKFFFFYTILTAMALFGATQYHKFYYYATNYYGDEESAKRSVQYTDGGMEYYQKMLQRHRLLRKVLDKGQDLFTPAGNLNGVGLNYVFRYGKLKDMTIENDEFAPVFEGDMLFNRLFLRQKLWRRHFSLSPESVHAFFSSRFGSSLFFACTTPIVIYPIGSLILNGPLISKTFKWRYDVEDNLPEHLQALINEEYEKFLQNDTRTSLRAEVEHYLQNGMVDTDSIIRGFPSLFVGGARIALPFFAQFKSYDEAKEYCRKHLGTLKLKNSSAVIDWDSGVGQKLIETFILSDNAKRFLIYRDFVSSKRTQELTNTFINTFGYFTGFTIFWNALFAYTHKGNDAAVLRVVIIINFLILFALLYRKYRFYQNAYDADEEAGHCSKNYAQGGVEYYQKMLQRNRILRGVLDNGMDLFTAEGNLTHRIGSEYFPSYDIHYEKLKGMTTEDDDF
ncbi:hypothetical protein M3Y97_00936800 [Aphelenchoides bicaudatus]|nr:hypothetical protein M3Y97_00936800 [Aphelenchoides bicaudatus]